MTLICFVLPSGRNVWLNDIFESISNDKFDSMCRSISCRCTMPGPTVVQLRKYKLCTVLSIWRTLQSVNDFCGRLFDSVASNLHLRLIFCMYEMFTKVRCHLSVILFIQFFQLSLRLFERRARYWPFRNINRERCYSPTRESTSRKSTVLTTSGMVPTNICAFFVSLRIFSVIFKNDWIWSSKY